MLLLVRASGVKQKSRYLGSSRGEIVQPVDPELHEVFATFRDPAGNVLGIYQQPGLAEAEGHEA